MANTPNLQIQLYLKAAMDAFKRAIVPIGLFSVGLSKKPLPFIGKREVVVDYYSLESAASRDFDSETGYVADDISMDSKTVAINKRKYQSMGVTSADIANNTQIDWKRKFAQKGAKLAYDIVSDILSNITVANFGAALGNFTASGFDLDDLIDIRKSCNMANWPTVDRGLIIGSDFSANIVKDLKDKGGMSTFGFDPLAAKLPSICGFKQADWDNFPSTIAGCAIHPSALLVGFSPITPVDPERVHYQTYEDPETGLMLEYRDWVEPGKDKMIAVVECNYGAAKGEQSACKILGIEQAATSGSGSASGSASGSGTGA